MDRKEDRLLLITRDVLDAPQYSDDNYYPVWSESNIRSWLNNEFYQNAFTGEEKERIIPADVTFTTVLGEDGVWGEETVTDNVFLLNAMQAEQFFASNEDRRAAVSDKTAGTAVTENGSAPWWLVGVGFESQGAAQVTSSGEIDTYRISVENHLGVRPVIWVSL